MIMFMLLYVLIIKGNEYVFNEYLWFKELYYFEYKKIFSCFNIVYLVL